MDKKTKIKILFVLIVFVAMVFILAFLHVDSGISWDGQEGVWINGKLYKPEQWIAGYEKNRPGTLINMNSNDFWNHKVQIIKGDETGFEFANDKKPTIWWSTALCMYHRVGNSVTSGNSGWDIISDVIDFRFDPSKEGNYAIKLNNTGTEMDIDVSRFNQDRVNIPKLVYSIASAEKNDSSSTYTPYEKNAINYYFHYIFKEHNIGITSDFMCTPDNTDWHLEKDLAKLNNILNYSQRIENYKEIKKEDTNIDTTVELLKNVNVPKENDIESGIEENLSKFGPFKINGGDGVDTINLWDESQTISSQEFKMYISLDGVNWTKFQKGIISDGTSFYVGIPYDYNNHSNIKINFTSPGIEYYNARLILCLNPKGSTDVNKAGQQLGIYSYEVKNSNGGSLEYDIEMPSKNTLKIVKSAETESGERQKNVGFIIYKTDGHDGKPYGYLRHDEGAKTGFLEYDEKNGWGFYTDNTDLSREAATVFYTDSQVVNGSIWDGFFQISNLPNGNYFIGEVYNENKNYEDSKILYYTVTIDDLNSEKKYDIKRSENNISRYIDKMPQTQTINLILNGGKNYRIGIVDTNETITDATIVVKKKNGSTSTKPNGVEFKIQCISGSNNGKYVKVKDDDSIEYVGESQAEVFKTTDGSFQVKLPTTNNYKIIETKNPYKGYQNIYIDKVEITPNTAMATISSSKNSVNLQNLKAETYNVTITDKYDPNPHSGTTIPIAGRVWISNGVGGKTNEHSSIYDSSTDFVVKGASVYLVNKNGASSYKATTGADGKYSFTVKNINLSEYYIQVRLNNNCKLYKGGEIAKDENNKEISFDVTKYVKVKNDYNNDEGCKFYTYNDGEANTYTGKLNESTAEDENDGTTENEKMENICGLSGIYNNGQNQHINLGLMEISTQQSLTQVVKKVEITTNGYTYTYNYNNRKPTDDRYMTTNIPTTNWGTTYGYTQNIYPSDIRAATTEVSGENINMVVRITYTITIENKTNGSYYKENGFTTNEEDYDLDNFKVTAYENYLLVKKGELTNTFDNSLYSLDDSNWDVSSSGNKATYNEEIKVNENDKQSVDITFKVNNEAIREILNTGKYSRKEQYATKAETYSYHKWHEEWDWTVDVTKTDKEGNEYTVTKKKHKTRPTQTLGPNYNYADAPAFLFKLSNQRTISGTVFEDNATEDNLKNHETIGNGKLDSGENTIENVKVELLKAGTTDKYAKMYTDNSKGSRAKDAVTYTDSNGKYIFENVVPGNYYVRFTYGDGNQRISDGKSLYAGQYKSTIYTQETPAYKETGGKWYLDNVGDRYSLALDNIDDRKFDSKSSTYDYSSLYEGVNNDRNKYNVTANTPDFDIRIEYSHSNVGSGNVQYKDFNEMNFGIIKMPVVSVNIYNTISYVTMTLSNGQVITQGDPSGTTNIQYVSTLDENDTPYGYGRGGYVKVEIDTNYLYGSTLEVTYDIKVLNNSDLNYKTKNYYYYGEHGEASDEYTVSIDRILYYIDPEMTYMYSTKKNIEIEGYSETSDKKLESISPENNASKINAVREITKEPKEMLDIKLNTNKEIHTYYSKDEESSKLINVLSVTTSKLLSTEDDDLEFKNYAEVVKITTDKDGNGNICRFMAPTASFESAARNVLGSSEDKLSDITKNSRNSLYRRDYRSITTDVATITVTPPTGLKENLIIIISIGIGLIVFVGGVIIIKKKVL